MISTPSFRTYYLALFIVPMLYGLYHWKTSSVDPQDYFYQAKNYSLSQEYEKAIPLYTHYLEHDPHAVAALYHLGEAYLKLEQYADAAYFFKQALNKGIPTESKGSILFNYALALYKSNNLEDALVALNESITLRAEPKAFAQRALIYQELEMLHNAFEDFSTACKADSSFAQGFINLGNCYKKQENYHKALNCYQLCKTYQPEHTDINLSIAETAYLLYMITKHKEFGELSHRYFSESLKTYDQPYKIYHGLGNLACEQEDLDESLALFEKANALIEKMAHDPHNDFTFTILSLGCTYLKMGNFKKGWKQIQKWRNNKAIIRDTIKKQNKPKWNGEPLQGKTILLTWEQGFGDTFQFIRYAQELKKQGAQIIVLIQNRLKEIIGLCPFIDQVLIEGDALPHFDYHCSIMEQVNFLSNTIEDIPSDVPYLYADPKLVQMWRQRLATNNHLKVALVWHIDPTHDRIPYLDIDGSEKHVHYPLRSIPTNLIQQISTIPGVEFYSLHTADLNLPSVANVHTFNNLDSNHGGFMDTAAILKNVDLLITADTSIAHLAGGLGIQTWLLLCKPGEWRWLHNTDSSPWYPTFTLFRQKERGDWQTLIDEVTTALKEYTLLQTID